MMSLLDRENRFLLIRLVIVAGLTMGCASLMVRSILGSDDEASTETDRPTRVEVKRVLGGDTIKIRPKDKMIYAGIRAPGEGEPLYEEAKQRNTDLVAGAELRLRFDMLPRDSKGRLHAYAFLDGRLVNEMLVREGLAYVRLTTSNQCYADRLLASQREAREERLGIWRHVSESDEHDYPADPKYGNFHRPSCEEIPKINPARLVALATKDEAFDAGYAPCRQCAP